MSAVSLLVEYVADEGRAKNPQVPVEGEEALCGLTCTTKSLSAKEAVCLCLKKSEPDKNTTTKGRKANARY